jgi:hypothetical protein
MANKGPTQADVQNEGALPYPVHYSLQETLNLLTLTKTFSFKSSL